MNGVLLLVAGFVSIALVVMGITAVSNFFLFPRLRLRPLPDNPPLVSLLIPARNEAAVIAGAVSRLLAQTYPNFELILLDDNSQDGTAELAQEAAGDDPRFRLMRGRPLPDGWLGKNWACRQLSEAARGEILIFSDADVIWRPDALAAVVGNQFSVISDQYSVISDRYPVGQQPDIDLLTVWPTQQTETWPERLVVPTMALAILAYLPVLPVHYTSWPIFAAANGQCMVFRREAYRAVGGHAAARGEIVEDVALARRIKAAGRRLRMVDGNRLIGCRMYGGWQEVRDGFAKNILAGYGNSVPFLLASTVFHWLVFVFPWIWLAVTGSLWALALAAGGVILRGATAVFTRQRARDAFFMPLTVLLMTRIAAQSIWQHYRGGPTWKGRVLKRRA